MSQLSFFPEDFNARDISLSKIHTSKRGRRERQGVHAWHPYYAGYAEQFVIDVLELLSKPGNLILDPWNGSGTTTFVSHRLGRPAIGIEINPVMTIHARAKSLYLVNEPESLAGLSKKLAEVAISGLNKQRKPSSDLELLVGSNALNTLLSLTEAIFSTLPIGHTSLSTRDVFKINPNIKHISNLQAFFISTCFRILREIGNFSQGSNPTWIKVGKEGSDYSSEEVLSLFLKLVESMIQDLLSANSSHTEVVEFDVINGDSRELPLVEDCIDLVITSPPYCTRIDYAVSTKPELFLLGFTNTRFDKLRRASIGAPVIVDKSIEIQQLWGKSCNAFLQSVATHNSKASCSYYLPIYLQYFQDVFFSIKEILRVLKPEAKAVVVVQSSYFKDVELPLGEIYVEMAHSLGCPAKIGRREIVKQHMAHINNKSNGYVKNKIYYEDVIVIKKSTGTCNMSDRSIYSNHAEQRETALPSPERVKGLEEALLQAFHPQIQYREVPFILFDQVGVEDLARAFYECPITIKSILSCVNVAQRAVKRDLGIDIDTYTKCITEQRAAILAGYIKPMLPRELAIPALLMLDHFFWVDKEMRATKGRWEKKIVRYLNSHTNRVKFKKRKFEHQGSKFELDAAYPIQGTPILIGVDVKRFESERDYHKRGDEITQKALHFKTAFPDSKFYAVIYYPFPSNHENVIRRYANQGIDGIYFAGETDEMMEDAAIGILESLNLDDQ